MTIQAKRLIDEDDILHDFIDEKGRAVFACHPESSFGRIHEESESKTRNSFQRDRDRVIHSNSFRRLKHKTQVFVSNEGDHYRTRLTHSIEVAQVARSLARALRVDEDLAEVCALAHDLGHTPFAHVGEEALKECMQPYGGFDHNDQTLRVVTMLENRYPLFEGLNLTWETLEGLIKHNGPVVKKTGDKPYEVTLRVLKDQIDMQLDSYASIEAQSAGIADDIAYNSHDLDDGFAAGMFTLDDLMSLPLLNKIITMKRSDFTDISEKIMMYEVIRELMGYMIQDVLVETKKRLTKVNPASVEDIRNAGMQIVGFSDEMVQHDKELRTFLMDRFYTHERLSRTRHKVFKVVQELFKTFMEFEKCLPEKWTKQIHDVPKGWDKENWRARTVADYIASMSDRKALLEHKDLFDMYETIKL